jgi:hypothetical protein
MLNDRLGNLHTLEGDFPAARMAQGKHLVFYNQEALTNNHDEDVVINQAGGHRNLATIELTCERDHEAALAHLIQGRDLMQRLSPSGVLERVAVLRQQLNWMERHIIFCRDEVPQAITRDLEQVATLPDAMMLLVFRGHWLARKGRVVEAAETASRLRKLKSSPILLEFEAARILAIAARHQGPPAELHARDAVAALNRAIGFGYVNHLRLRNEVAFDSLRNRDDFKKVLADLEARVPLLTKAKK